VTGQARCQRALATVLLQAPRHLPLVQRPPHVEHGRAPDRPCHRSRPHPAAVGPDGGVALATSEPQASLRAFSVADVARPSAPSFPPEFFELPVHRTRSPLQRSLSVTHVGAAPRWCRYRSAAYGQAVRGFASSRLSVRGARGATITRGSSPSSRASAGSGAIPTSKWSSTELRLPGPGLANARTIGHHFTCRRS
jgi:hypothetical protein